MLSAVLSKISERSHLSPPGLNRVKRWSSESTHNAANAISSAYPDEELELVGVCNSTSPERLPRTADSNFGWRCPMLMTCFASLRLEIRLVNKLDELYNYYLWLCVRCRFWTPPQLLILNLKATTWFPLERISFMKSRVLLFSCRMRPWGIIFSCGVVASYSMVP